MWRILVSWVITGSCNGMRPNMREAIVWTDVGLLFNWTQKLKPFCISDVCAEYIHRSGDRTNHHHHYRHRHHHSYICKAFKDTFVVLVRRCNEVSLSHQRAAQVIGTMPNDPFYLLSSIFSISIMSHFLWEPWARLDLFHLEKPRQASFRKWDSKRG